MGSRESGAQKHKDHAQDCGTLIAFARSASGDPAMVFIFRMASILSAVTGTLPCPAAGLLLDLFRARSMSDGAPAHDRLQKLESDFFGRSCENARKLRA
jgi:hypothetical protein